MKLTVQEIEDLRELAGLCTELADVGELSCEDAMFVELGTAIFKVTGIEDRLDEDEET